jgi:hypothetical protein
MKSKFVNIEIDGAEYPVCFNINALREIEQASGKSIGEIEDFAKTITGMATVAQIGINHGLRVSGKPSSEFLTINQVGDMFDLDGLTGIVNAIAEFLPDQKKAKAKAATENR